MSPEILPFSEEGVGVDNGVDDDVTVGDGVDNGVGVGVAAPVRYLTTTKSV